MLYLKKLLPVFVFVAGMAVCGCRSTYYAMWEKVGKHKRDLLRSQVENAKDDQEAASEQFEDALTRLKALTGFDGGNLEKTYNALSADYDRCERRADAVHKRVNAVETIASDLFKEWEEELTQISTPSLRRNSQRKLLDTQDRFDTLLRSMRRAENAMSPVLTKLRDHVLYLKHNLNAQAIGSLKGEADAIEADVEALILEIQRAIREADLFVKALPE